MATHDIPHVSFHITMDPPPEITVDPPPEEPEILIKLNISVGLAPPTNQSVQFQANVRDAHSAIRDKLAILRQELNGAKFLNGSITLKGANKSLEHLTMKSPKDLQKSLDLVTSDNYRDPEVHVSVSFEQGVPPPTHQKVKNDLTSHMEVDFHNRKFIGVKAIRTWIKPKDIREILKANKGVDDRFCAEVYKNGVKILATLILANVSDLGNTFMCCWENETREDKLMRDDGLPFEKVDMPWNMQEADVEMFIKTQWQTCVFEFNISTPLPKKFGFEEILPIVKKQKIEGAEGHFGEVSEIKIAASHQKLYSCVWNQTTDPNPDPNPSLALKDFKRPFAQQMADFNRETLMLVELNKLNHKHLIKLLFAFTQDDNSGLIFPLAKCSLDGYFQNTDPTTYDQEKQAKHTTWLFEQFSGLVHGLSEVHENKQARNAELSLGETTTGYHHDIKPSNILLFNAHEVGKQHFEGAELEFGRLQISDFGLGKFRTKIEGTGTGTIQGTITYRAPECDPEEQSKKQNRKYDIWCLGCILLELLVWVFEGPKGHKKFECLRSGPQNTNDSTVNTQGFYHRHGDGRIELREAVTGGLEKLESDANGMKLEKPVRETIKLIKQCLQIDKDDRPKATEVSEIFSSIASSARAALG